MLITKSDINPARMPTSQDYIVSITENLQLTESYLDSFSNDENNIVTEGILGSIWKTIKTIAKKILSAIVAIWKGITAFCKMVFGKIKNFFRGSKDSATKLDTPIRAKFISMESARVGDQEFDSKDEVQKELLKATDSIAREIRMRSELQIECVKKLSEHDNDDIVTEAKRLKTPVVYNSDIFNQESWYNDNKTLSLGGKDYFDSQSQADLRLLPVEDFKRILNSNNLVEEYNSYCHDLVQAIGNTGILSDKQKSSIERLMRDRIFVLRKRGLTSQEINDAVIGEYFYVPNGENSEQIVRELLQLKLNYNRKITAILEDMIRCNYATLGYAKEEAEKVIKGIHNDVLRKQALGDVYTKIKANRDVICKTKGVCDFRKFGGGIVYYFPYDEIMLKEVDSLIEFYTLSLSYNFIINTHGGKTTTSMNSDDKIRARSHYRNLRRNDALRKISKWDDEKKETVKNVYQVNKLIEREIIQLQKRIEESKSHLHDLEKHSQEEWTKQYIEYWKNQIEEYSKQIHRKKREIQHNLALNKGHDSVSDKKFEHIVPELKFAPLPESISSEERVLLTNKPRREDMEREFIENNPEAKKLRDEIHALENERRQLDIFSDDEVIIARDEEISDRIAELEDQYGDLFLKFRRDKTKQYKERAEKIRIKYQTEFEEMERLNAEYRAEYERELKKVEIYNAKVDELESITKSFWSCYPVKIGNHPLTDDVNQAIRYCIEDGKKSGLRTVKIYVYACNGENMPIEDDILETPGVIVNAGTSVKFAELSYLKERVYYIGKKYTSLILEASNDSKYSIVKKFFSKHYNVNPASLKQEWIKDHYNDPIVLYECPKMLAIDNCDGSFGFMRESATVIETTIGGLYKKTIS